MNNVSLAGVGMYAFLIVSLLQIVGVTADLTNVESVIASGIQVFSFVIWVIGQVRRADLTGGLFRKV